MRIRKLKDLRGLENLENFRKEVKLPTKTLAGGWD